MPDIELPTSWLGLLGLLILVIGWVLVSRQQRIRADLSAVKDQVRNGHTTPMRSDLDGIAETLRAQGELLADIQGRQDGTAKDIRGLREDVGGLRGELRDEREARAELGESVRKLAKRKGWPLW